MRFLAACSILLASGCSVSTLAVRTTARLVERGRPALRGEPDPELARSAIPAQLKLVEALLESDPANPELLAVLAEGWTGYAFLFLEEEEPARAAALYRRAAGYGLRLLERRKAFRGLAAMPPEAMEDVLAGADRRDVHALYWTAMAWAGWANADKSDPAALAAAPKAVRLMSHVQRLDPGFEHGGPDLFFAVWYSARPKIAGGDAAKALRHFEAALERTGRRYLVAHYLMMRHYAVAELDEELFARLAAEAAAADPAALPDARLANAAAKRKAAALLERKDDLF